MNMTYVTFSECLNCIVESSPIAQQWTSTQHYVASVPGQKSEIYASTSLETHHVQQCVHDALTIIQHMWRPLCTDLPLLQVLVRFSLMMMMMMMMMLLLLLLLLVLFILCDATAVHKMQPQAPLVFDLSFCLVLMTFTQSSNSIKQIGMCPKNFFNRLCLMTFCPTCGI